MKLFLPRQASAASSHLVRRPTARFLTAMSPPASRTYADALGLLDTLIPNTKVHALFGKPQTAVPGGSPQPPQQPASDPNLLAIPEMRAWLLRANLTPQRLSALSCIHIAGTKGKGSVAALTTSALLAAAAADASAPARSGTGTSPGPGRVGTYTSPHLVSPRERIAIDGRPVSQPLFAAAFFELWDALSACPADRDDGVLAGVPAGAKPFYFRFLTLLAFHIFLREGVRSVVLECGIGGEYDATNAVVGVVAGDGDGRGGGGGAAVTAAVITQLGVDHVAMLGDTPEAIAWHKAGVMKPGVPAFTRRLDDRPAVMDVLRARARDARARLVEVPDDAVDAWPGVSSSAGSGGPAVDKLPAGAFQKRNQALAALAAAHHLRDDDDARALLRDVPEAVVAGLREATLRGRHEVLERGDVAWHLDGAHNADSLAEAARWAAAVVFVVGGDTAAAAAAAAAASATTKFVLVFNQQERDASALLLGLLREMEAAGVDVASRLDAAIFTRNDKTGGGGGGGGGAGDAEKEAAAVDVTVQERCAAAFREAYPGVEALVCRDLTEMKGAVDAVARDAGVRVRVLVTGSMYLVGNVIGLLEPDGLL
ncbi:Mur ligase [Colletotrichum zoysiae]|uniref:tetrahydrofolate synthase n=1 Tax=Colletotrichum zoysiae TaxID=1216348 RepID=A0AAD9H733_9PEZI|nr:Mur ligase [Colletotrichum zoysiae]